MSSERSMAGKESLLIETREEIANTELAPHRCMQTHRSMHLPPEKLMANVALVGGAWMGAWCWKRVLPGVRGRAADTGCWTANERSISSTADGADAGNSHD